MYASEDATRDENPTTEDLGAEEYQGGETYEDSTASFDEAKFSVPELDSSPFRSSVTQYSDGFSHKDQDLEELGAIPSTLFDSPVSKNGKETGQENRAIKRTHSERLSNTPLGGKSPKLWQEGSGSGLASFYSSNLSTYAIAGKSIVEKNVARSGKTQGNHTSSSIGISSSLSKYCESGVNFESTQETEKSTKLFDYSFTESLGSYAKQKLVQENVTNTSHLAYSEKWTSIPSRYLQVTNLPKTMETWMLKEIFEKFGDIQGILSKNLRSDGSVIVGFYDVRDCIRIQKQLRHYRFFNDRYLEAQFCSKTTLIAMSKGGTSLPFLSENEGEIIISLQGSGDLSKNVLFNLLSSYGDIRVIKSPSTTMKKTIICEYFDIRDAMLAVDELNGRVVQNNKLHATFYESGFISWKIVSNELQHLQDKNTVLDQFKSLDISEGGLNNVSNEYLINHESANVVSRSKLSPPLEFFLNKKGSNGPIMDRSNSVPCYFLQNEKPPYTASMSNGSGNIDYYKHHNVRKPTNLHISDNTSYVHLNDRYTKINSYLHSSAVKEALEEAKVEPHNPAFIPGSPSNQRQIYSANMKRSITHDGVWMEHSPPITEHLPLNLKYPFDVLKMIGNSSPRANLITEKNKVNYDRITRGLDMRTTIMIKNIPNKFTQQMLQEYIDATNPKTYDFLYLRIDFRNRCNVGYAFVNFIDPISIVTFGQARVGTKWNRFHSDKICDISYANIQGKECLIEKFRNSCVMDEDPSYRPKIFISHGPATGEEQEFPAPNNPRRKLRSIVSAQQIGLFPPVGSRAPWCAHEEQAFL
ncbi:hypothetical protein T552_02331 [Pneumocystis carinii B80]|uniref:RRM domain-containing protein n=1 Tax=Pneumocystis carinii (strain B80) TaxID=1408658 RepID=A0A0W4ZG57_PNEC8|nr:hypothetical protein T552_02331 [Pneumocystis carinii B80]KTW27350.1 hypothetical protein T552_02331 [Pneumocystis carinii B80]